MFKIKKRYFSNGIPFVNDITFSCLETKLCCIIERKGQTPIIVSARLYYRKMFSVRFLTALGQGCATFFVSPPIFDFENSAGRLKFVSERN